MCTYLHSPGRRRRRPRGSPGSSVSAAWPIYNVIVIVIILLHRPPNSNSNSNNNNNNNNSN